MKSGVLLFNDYSTSICSVSNPPVLTYYTYIGKKGLSNFAGGGGGGSASSANGNFNVTGDIIGGEDLELNTGIIIQDDFLFDTSATRLFPDARFENLEVRDGLTVYGDLSVNSFRASKLINFSGDLEIDTLNTANIIQFDRNGTPLDVDLSGDVYRNSITTFGNIDAGGNLSVSGDASLNGRVDICGNFYAQYPANSIPFTSIEGLSSGVNPDVDLSLNAGLSVGSDVSFNSGLTVDGNVGIGTTSPIPKVDVSGAVFLRNETLTFSSGGGGGNATEEVALVFNQGIDDRTLALKTDTNANLYGTYGGGGGRATRWRLGGNDAFYFLNNVGIGTDNPSNKLHIYATDNTSNFRISNSDSTTGFILEQSTNKYTYIRNTESTGGIIFHAGNGERMRIMSDGKIGIHPTGVDPKFQLDVWGQLLAYHSSYGNAGVEVKGRNYGETSTGDHDPWEGYTTARFQEAVIAKSFFAYSDSRIKTNIEEVNDTSALDKLRLLKPCLLQLHRCINAR